MSTHKFLKYAALGIIVCTSTLSCSKLIDEAYQNPNAETVQPIETLMPNVVANLVCSYTAAGTNYGPVTDNYYIARYVQYWVSNTNSNQYDKMGGVTGAGDALGNVWAAHYYGMGQNLNRIVEWGIEQQKWDYVGAAWAMRAWSWLSLTDQYGEVILKQAFNTSRDQFDYDTQEEVYDTVRATAFRALTYLNMTGGNMSTENLAKGDFYLNKGDLNKWKKFTYGVLARSYNHLSNKSSYQPDSVIKYCDLAMTTNADNTVYTFANDGTTETRNYFGPGRGNVASIFPCEFLVNLLNGANPAFPVTDPRIYYFLRENNNGTFKGIKPGYGASGSTGLSTNDLPKNFFGNGYTSGSTLNPTPRYLFGDASPWPVMTASEMQFMKAEAAYRKGDKAMALEAYRNGISLSLDLVSQYPQNIPAGKEITAEGKEAFLSNLNVVPDAAHLTLTHIMLQKYIAMYIYGVSETWVDMRRYHYNADTDPVSGQQVYAGWTPLAPADLFIDNNQKLVYRCRPRYNSEYLYNIPALTRIGALALDYHTKECWFSQK